MVQGISGIRVGHVGVVVRIHRIDVVVTVRCSLRHVSLDHFVVHVIATRCTFHIQRGERKERLERER